MIAPSVAVETYRAPVSGNMYRRMFLERGAYSIRYDANVRLSPLVHDPQSVFEVTIKDLPALVAYLSLSQPVLPVRPAEALRVAPVRR